jgi:hypothetical protein
MYVISYFRGEIVECEIPIIEPLLLRPVKDQLAKRLHQSSLAFLLAHVQDLNLETKVNAKKKLNFDILEILVATESNKPYKLRTISNIN